MSTTAGGQPDAGTGKTPPEPMRQQRRWLIGLALLLCLVVAGLVVHLWLERQEVARLREEMAQRLQTGDSVSSEARGIARSMQDTVFDLQAKVAALESRQQDSSSQHESLQQMYQELAKNRDDRVLTDIEQIVLMANQQLQLSANVHGTLIALENADRLLAREDKPQLTGIRRALARDIERLRAVPHVDVTGMAVKLDVVIAQVPTLQLLSDAKIKETPGESAAGGSPDSAPASGEGAADAKGGEASLWAKTTAAWSRFTGEFWSEVKSMVHVRNVESPEALILSPSQAYFLRENLTLRLLGARVSMLARDHASFTSDMKAATEMIDRYFDTTSPAVIAAKTTLSQVREKNIAVELPTLSESLTALQNYRTRP